MKHVYAITLICLTLAMGCQRPERRGPAPADEVVGTLPETVPVENSSVETPSAEEPVKQTLLFNLFSLPESQELTLTRNEALNGDNNPVKGGCSEYSKMKHDFKRANDELGKLPELTPEDGIDNPDAQGQRDQMVEAMTAELQQQEAALIAKGKSKLVTATFTVKKDLSSFTLPQLRNEIEIFKQQKVEVSKGAANDPAYEGTVDEIAASLAAKSQELYEHLALLEMAKESSMSKEEFNKNFEFLRESNPAFNLVIKPISSVQVSLIVGDEVRAQQESQSNQPIENQLNFSVVKGNMKDTSPSIEVAVDMSYDVVCNLKDATKAYKKEKKDELKPSLRMSVK